MEPLNPNTEGINIFHEFESGLNGFSELGGGTHITNVTPQLIRYVQGNIRFFKKLGYRRFRIFTPDWSWEARLDYLKVFIELVAQEGDLHMEWGVGPNGLGSTWPNFLDAVDQYIVWYQNLINQYADRGITGGWIVANELENSPPTVTAVSMTRTSNVVTVVMSYEHRMAVNDKYSINSALTGNVFVNVTSIPNANAFTFAQSGSDGTQSGGTVQMNAYAMRQQIHRLGYHFINDLGITLPLSYSVLQGYEATNLYYFTRGWKTAGAFPQIGRGPITHPDLNIYGESSSDPETNWRRWKLQVDAAIADIGADRLRITEWNMHHTDDMAPTYNNNLMRRSELLLRRRRYLNMLGIPYYFFASKMGAYLGEIFPISSNVNLVVRPSLYRLIGKKSPFVELRPL